MYNLFQTVSDYCVKKRGQEFFDYAKKRNWNEETMNKWKLGFFPQNDVLSLKVKIRNVGGSEDDLVSNGILNKYGQSFFSGRITFPVVDAWGNEIAMTGRALTEVIKPKYFNTVYEKGKNLYGLHLAIPEIVATKRVYVFEGNADVITSHQFGIKNSVCVMGTTLSEDHFLLLSRYAKEIVLIFDNDAGGKKALASFNEKKIDTERKETTVYRCMFNGYKDADEFLNKTSKEEVVKYIEDFIANPKLQSKLKNIVKADNKNAQKKA
jgi:DNA primase